MLHLLDWVFTSVANKPRNAMPLIVDDVMTTGASMQKVRESFGYRTIGVVIFSRTKEVPSWIYPLFVWGIGIPLDYRPDGGI